MRIEHSNGGYDVTATTLASAADLIPSDARIVTDKTVEQVASAALAGRHFFAVEPGESSKSLPVFGELLSWLAKTNASRKTTLVAIGGGVVGDLAGFVAASYMRGIPFIQIPTTLLAMVDSSVGGKVGIDLPEGKNLAGAFKPPNAVHIPLDLLKNLPERQFRNGMAEVLKTGFILDEALSERLRRQILDAASSDLESVVMRCIELKGEVVRDDEFELTGLRAILNFGHTIGHAVEHASGYRGLLHGEAISVGMALEAKLGESLGITQPGTSQIVIQDLERYGLPTKLDGTLRPRDLIETMYRDKKAVEGSLGFSLLTCLGGCKLVRDVPARAVEAVMEQG
jgi:3-dehydroquinate synthase